MSEQIQDLLKFLAEATTPFHAVAAISWRLAAAGFEEIRSVDDAVLEPG